ncbi:MAG TPA: hypothetical protein VGL86_20525 [Polyangia bacterium]|jgi:hypothetical protein
MGTSILRIVLFVAAAAAVAVGVEPSRLDSWVLVGRHDQHLGGSTRDLSRALAVAGDGPALWARRGGDAWLIRDVKLVARARALLAPLDELGQKMAPLGQKQGVLGARQGEMGRQMGELSSDPERNGAAMEALGRRMEALGREQEAIGRDQEAIGARMEAAGRELDAKMAALVDEARAAGQAQPVK